ncbi:DUF429 domain-containing protein [Pseudonocardia endophytica]|uniref:Putative RNase H-like nuclease n=1 Tax=Pseudonocardia endophytica TaxID=401976 RepID=A0A4R1HJ28_PSEEN|nr:DUF429 domain-containing protein [Pseudonocardia endophytica]TCK20981.1 putative RNase H-like nuclease [Pseudonocardia endophytica]
MNVAGVDGVPSGWVVCVVSPGSTVAWSVVPDAQAVLDVTSGCDAVGVDIPLALPVGAERREAEILAAARLGSARSSLFPTPPAEVLAAPTYADACSVARELTGKAISLQTFHIGPKIRDWQAVSLPEHVVEAHPEMSFRTLAPDLAFAGKKTARGAGQRIAALARWLDPAALLTDLPARGTRLDDALDALATAWSAARWGRDEAEELGPGRDARGRRLQIVV